MFHSVPGLFIWTRAFWAVHPISAAISALVMPRAFLYAENSAASSFTFTGRIHLTLGTALTFHGVAERVKLYYLAHAYELFRSEAPPPGERR